MCAYAYLPPASTLALSISGPGREYAAKRCLRVQQLTSLPFPRRRTMRYCMYYIRVAFPLVRCRYYAPMRIYIYEPHVLFSVHLRMCGPARGHQIAAW